MGKASRRKDIVDVIKEQTRKEKRDAGMRRSNATGISAAALSMIGPAHTMGEGAGHRAVGGGDLNMHTYDILDVDRLKFSTLAGSQDRLIATDHGIESASYFIDDQENILSFGMNFQIPGSDSMGATGMAYYFKIGTSAAQVKIVQNNYSGVNLTLKSADSGAKPAALTFEGASTEANVNALSIFSDGTDLKAKNSSGTVYTLTTVGSGGATTELDNLGTTSINADLLPDSDAGQDLGANGTAWGSLYTDSIRLYSGTASASPAKTHGGYIRLYVGNSHRYIAYYN